MSNLILTSLPVSLASKCDCRRNMNSVSLAKVCKRLEVSSPQLNHPKPQELPEKVIVLLLLENRQSPMKYTAVSTVRGSYGSRDDPFEICAANCSHSYSIIHHPPKYIELS